MGTLGAYLKSARESRGLDLRDAAQQTRISFQYLKALEEENFSKLPGEVFVKGFLKNYVKFLKLDEAEVLKRYAEIRSHSASSSAHPHPAAPPQPVKKPVEAPAIEPAPHTTSWEPFIWGTVIIAAIAVFVFSSPPRKSSETPPVSTSPLTALTSTQTGTQQAVKPEKLYLEIIGLDSVWVLVRIDSSPQKKAVLKKGESVIWSADERFLISYGNINAIKLLLNGKELIVTGPQDSVVRDLTITAAGITSQQLQPRPLRRPRPKRQPPVDATPSPLTPNPPAQTLSAPVEQPKAAEPIREAQPEAVPAPQAQPPLEPSRVVPENTAAPVGQ